MNIKATVTSLDCNHGVCPQIQETVTHIITGGFTVWYYPPSTSNLISTVIVGQVSGNVDNIGFTATIVSNNSGLTTNLYFTATNDKN